MKVNDVIDVMEKYAPCELASDWDNVGLMLGDRDAEAGNVLLCLDVTSDVVDKAMELGCDMIISHHPYIFQSMKNIDLGRNQQGKDIVKLIKNDIAVYSAHTNLDYTQNGINDCLKDICEGIVKSTIDTFATELKSKLSASAIRVIYAKGASGNEPVTGIVSSCGGFDKDRLNEIMNSDANVLVVGEVRYNDTIMFSENGMNIIEAGHYETEAIIIPHLHEYLSTQLPDIKFHQLTKAPFKHNIIV